jgi:hypothetical protein
LQSTLVVPHSFRPPPCLAKPPFKIENKGRGYQEIRVSVGGISEYQDIREAGRGARCEERSVEKYCTPDDLHYNLASSHA